MKRKDFSQTSFLNDITLDDLKKKQSVRVSFKLPESIIELLGVIAGQLGIKQKTLLDQLLDDEKLLEQLIAHLFNVETDTIPRRQKTFVVSRSSVKTLNRVAKKHKVARDSLVELSIRRLQPLIEDELKKHNRRKEVLEDMHLFLKNAEKLLNKTQDLLGDDDDLCAMLENQVCLAKRNITTVNSIIKKGRSMEGM